MLIKPDDLLLSNELTRPSSSKQFEERLRASIEEVGLAEPLKVARTPDKRYLVIDGVMRLRAIQAIRLKNPTCFSRVPAYIVDYSRRYEIRFQTDIYQDLLPSQLAVLVEHLHKTESVRKVDIARYIGVSPPTVRNYTGLWRMLERGALFGRIVDLMDVGVMPSSNPYAWLRLTGRGIRLALEQNISGGQDADAWIDARLQRARRGDVAPLSLKQVEAATSSLPADCYREDQELRLRKRDIGLRRGTKARAEVPAITDEAVSQLTRVAQRSREPVLRGAAQSLLTYLQ